MKSKKQNYLYNWAGNCCNALRAQRLKSMGSDFQPFTEIQTNKGVVCIRPFEERDIEAVMSYLYESSPEYLTSIGIDIEKLPGYEIHRAKLKRRVKRSFQLVAAECCGECVAMVSIHLRQGALVSSGHFHVVNPHFRHKGIGAPVLAVGLGLLMQAHKLTSIYLEPKHDNLAAARLAQKLGGVCRGVGRSERGLTTDHETIVYEVFYEQLVQLYRGFS